MSTVESERAAAAEGAPRGAEAPANGLFRLITGYYCSAAIHVACVLSLPDLLGDGTRGYAELAAAAGCDPGALLRLLRLLASFGLVEQCGDDAFGLTPTGRLLRADGPDSMRALALQFAGPGMQRTWTDLLYSVRTGLPAFEHAHGQGPFAYLAEHPDDAAVFNSAMAFLGGQAGAALARGEALDFSRLRSLVDVGGGYGTLLAGLLEANPGLRGTVFELPHVASGAERLLAERGLAERASVVAGDVFNDPLPEDADAYLLKHVIHDFDDPRAIEILRSCRTAMRDDSRVMLVESVLPDRVQESPLHLRMTGSDLNMLVQLGGRERAEHEFHALLDAAGLRACRVARVGDLPCGLIGTTSIIEAVRR